MKDLNLIAVGDFVEKICQDQCFENDGRLVDFISNLVTEEKGNFYQQEGIQALLDKFQTATISSDIYGEITAEYINTAFAVGFVLGRTDFRKNGHPSDEVRRALGEIKNKLIKEEVLDPEVLPSNRCCGAKKSLVRIAQGGNGAGQKSKPALATS